MRTPRPTTLQARDVHGAMPRVETVRFRLEGETMATAKQKAAARKNIKKAAAAAKRKKTIAHLPKKTRTALGKQGAKMAKRKSA
jgi:hypothetical protein